MYIPYADIAIYVGGLLSMITVKMVLIIHQASSTETGFLLFEDKGAFKLGPFSFISSIWVYFLLAFNFSHGNECQKAYPNIQKPLIPLPAGCR